LSGPCLTLAEVIAYALGRRTRYEGGTTWPGPRWSLTLVIVGSMLAVDWSTHADDEMQKRSGRGSAAMPRPRPFSSRAAGTSGSASARNEQAIRLTSSPTRTSRGHGALRPHPPRERHIAAASQRSCTAEGGKPACPPSPGRVQGRITAADVVRPAAQGLAAGVADELIRAMRSGAAYAQRHTDKHPSGEIRGQIRDGALAVSVHGRGATCARSPAAAASPDRAKRTVLRGAIVAVDVREDRGSTRRSRSAPARSPLRARRRSGLRPHRGGTSCETGMTPAGARTAGRS